MPGMPMCKRWFSGDAWDIIRKSANFVKLWRGIDISNASSDNRLMRAVSIVGTAQLPVVKQSPLTLRALGATAVQQALADAGVDRVDALYAGNMLGDELQGQKHLAALIADESGLRQVEALEARAATASGAAALRLAYLAVAAGQADLAVAVGVEKMSDSRVTALLAKALDAEAEVNQGANMISHSAQLMRAYLERYGLPNDALAPFAVNAHRNARHNPNALLREEVTVAEVMGSRVIEPPLRLLDCSPVCDGAAAVVLAPRHAARNYSDKPVHILASHVATDRFRLADRTDPLLLQAARHSALAVYEQAAVGPDLLSLFELHDAFTVISCLLLEAAGFALPGEGWRLAAEGDIGLNGRIPIATFGGLKARGHPVGATGLYQACEIVTQLTERAGANQVAGARLALMQSVGAAGTTVITHLFGNS
jgi:acetyl-CoA C-acetyltransferase